LSIPSIQGQKSREISKELTEFESDSYKLFKFSISLPEFID